MLKEDLSEHLNKFSTNPYLFVGSGLSRRYLSLPTWLDLIRNFFPVLKLNKPFEYHLSKCNNNLPQLASSLAEEFHENWWNLIDFEESRNTYKSLASKGKMIPFKIELIDYLLKNTVLNEALEKEISLLKDAIIDGIITTNWDYFLSDIFPEYKVYIGQYELLFSDSFTIGEIFKIHGCCSDPSSIIVTEDDYRYFNDKNSYLAAKLLTVFVEHPIIFLGYSISDKNIIEILNSIVKCVDTRNIHKLKDRLIFVEWVAESIEPTMRDGNIVLNGSVIPIKHIVLNSYEELFGVLKNLKKRIPIKILRKLKDRFYEFIKTNKPTDKIYIGELDHLKGDEEIDFVVGVGLSNLLSEQGYKGIEAIDIIEDLLLDNKNFNANSLIDFTLPKLLKGNQYLPIFKYLNKEKYINARGEETNHNLDSKILKIIQTDKSLCYFPATSYAKKKEEIRTKYSSLKEMFKNENVVHSLNYIPLLESTSINQTELRDFLIKCFRDTSLQKNTQFKKVVCLYDYLKYGHLKQPVLKRKTSSN